jgi:hypothetical protein
MSDRSFLPDMAPAGMDHGSIVLQLNQRLVRAAGDFALVLPQSGVRLSDISEPQPDFTLLSDIGSTALSGMRVPVALPEMQIDLTDLLDE